MNEENCVKYSKMSDDELIELVRPILYPCIKQIDYDMKRKQYKYRLPSAMSLYLRFGSWHNFLLKAGVPINVVNETDEELMELYRQFSKNLGYPAKVRDLNNSDDIYNACVFITRFGSINKLRVAAGLKQIEVRQRISDEVVQAAVILVRKKYGEIKQMADLIEILKNEALPSYATLFNRLKVTTPKQLWEKSKELEKSLCICKADGCVNPCRPRKMYCSMTCRFRESKRRQVERRVALGLCVQCGGGLDRAGSDHCTKCYEYYHNRYKNSLKG